MVRLKDYHGFVALTGIVLLTMGAVSFVYGNIIPLVQDVQEGNVSHLTDEDLEHIRVLYLLNGTDNHWVAPDYVNPTYLKHPGQGEMLSGYLLKLDVRFLHGAAIVVLSVFGLLWLFGVSTQKWTEQDYTIVAILLSAVGMCLLWYVSGVVEEVWALDESYIRETLTEALAAPMVLAGLMLMTSWIMLMKQFTGLWDDPPTMRKVKKQRNV